MDTKLLMDNIEYIVRKSSTENAFSIYLSGLFSKLKNLKKPEKKL